MHSGKNEYRHQSNLFTPPTDSGLQEETPPHQIHVQWWIQWNILVSIREWNPHYAAGEGKMMLHFGKWLSISSHIVDKVVWDWCSIVCDSCRDMCGRARGRQGEG
jgi:hypothetical protein